MLVRPEKFRKKSVESLNAISKNSLIGEAKEETGFLCSVMKKEKHIGGYPYLAIQFMEIRQGTFFSDDIQLNFKQLSGKCLKSMKSIREANNSVSDLIISNNEEEENKIVRE